MAHISISQLTIELLSCLFLMILSQSCLISKIRIKVRNTTRIYAYDDRLLTHSANQLGSYTMLEIFSDVHDGVK